MPEVLEIVGEELLGLAGLARQPFVAQLERAGIGMEIGRLLALGEAREVVRCGRRS